MNEKTIPFDADLAEEKMINAAVKERQEAERRKAEAARYAEENNRRMAEAARKYKAAKLGGMAAQAFGWLAGCATLVILCHLGHIAGWLMYLTTTVWSLHLGIRLGREVGC